MGNTPLHCAAYRGQKQCIIKLLKSGANPSARNSHDQTVMELARTDELRQILAAFEEKEVKNGVQKIEGPLWKSSRFLGWRSHWVVIEEGTLSWYHREADALAGVRKQGCKSLSQAYCMVLSRISSMLIVTLALKTECVVLVCCNQFPHSFLLLF